MALIVEDGTGLANAESWIDATTAKAYWTARGNTVFSTLSDDAVEIALRKAADYITQEFFGRWSGTKLSYLQRLPWPRAYALIGDEFEGEYWPDDSVPQGIKDAQAFAAEYASRLDFYAQPAPGKLIKREKKVVGPLTKEFEYAVPTAGSSLMVAQPQLEAMLAPFLIGGFELEVVRL